MPITSEMQKTREFDFDFLPYLWGKPAFGISSSQQFTIFTLIEVPCNFYFNSTFVTKARFRLKQIGPQ